MRPTGPGRVARVTMVTASLLTGLSVAAAARADDPPAAVQFIPAAGSRPALALPPGAPAATDLKPPAWLKPAVRLSYHAGDSVIAGVASRLKPVPGKNGQWIDPKSGQNFNEAQVPTSGGVGYVQVNVLAVSPALLALDCRNYLIVDVARDIAVSSSQTAVLGDLVSAGIYWINPALLALVGAADAPPQAAGVKIARVNYAIGEHVLNAVSIACEYAAGFDLSVYDLDSGMLLSQAGSILSEGVAVIDPRTGQVSRGKGSTAIHHARLVGTRTLTVPWAAAPLPAWLAAGRRLDYLGSYRLVGPAGATAPLGLARSVQVARVAGGVAVAQVVTRSELGGGLPPQDAREDRCFSSAIVDPLWIAPQVLAGMQAGQVLDQDPITRFSTTFQTARDGVAVILGQGPQESVQYLYDLRSGLLVGVRATRQQPVGQVQLQLSLTAQQ